MANNKYTALMLLLFSLAAGLNGYAQDAKDTINDNVKVKGNYFVVLYAGGGLFSYLASVGPSGNATGIDITRLHPTGTFRLMWHPDHRLRLGIESGFQELYAYRLKDPADKGKVLLSAIPLMVDWSMAVTKRINVFAGIGAYLLTTRLDYNGKVYSKYISLGFSAAVNYVQPITRRTGIGVEIKWADATQTRDFGVSGEILWVWKMLKW